MSSAGPITEEQPDFDAERTVLGALLLNPSLLSSVESMVRVQDLTTPEHRTIYGAMLTMSSASRVIDPVMLSAELAEAGNLEAAGGRAFIGGLIDGLPRLSNVEAWARLIRERARRRALVTILGDAYDAAADPKNETDAVVDRAQQSLTKLTESGDGRIVRLRDVLARAETDLEAFGKASGVTGIETGLIDLDRCLGGLQPGRLYIIAARTSRGKSVLCAQLTVNAAKHGYRGLVFSMEMEPYQLAQRMLLAEANVDRWDLRESGRDTLAPEKRNELWGEIGKAHGRLSELPVWFDQRETPSLMQVRASAKQHHGGVGVDLVVLDYLQRMQVDPKVDRWLAVGDAARGLKSLAMALRVPVVAACQLNADAEEKRPTLASLAQAQSIISAEADAVILLHPDDLKKWKTQSYPIVHCLVDKNRTGPCQDVKVSFEKSTSRFVSMQQDAQRS